MKQDCKMEKSLTILQSKNKYGNYQRYQQPNHYTCNKTKPQAPLL